MGRAPCSSPSTSPPAASSANAIRAAAPQGSASASTRSEPACPAISAATWPWTTTPLAGRRCSANGSPGGRAGMSSSRQPRSRGSTRASASSPLSPSARSNGADVKATRSSRPLSPTTLPAARPSPNPSAGQNPLTASSPRSSASSPEKSPRPEAGELLALQS